MVAIEGTAVQTLAGPVERRVPATLRPPFRSRTLPLRGC